jgi:hypothetical protein
MQLLTLTLPLSTRISHLKTLILFDNGTKRAPPDKFTLEHKGKELSDAMTLASIYTPGQELVLTIHSFTFTVKEESGRFEFPLKMKVDDSSNFVFNDQIVQGPYRRIIAGHIYSRDGTSPDRITFVGYPNGTCPGGTYIVKIRQN